MSFWHGYDVLGTPGGESELISSMSFLFAAGSIFQIWRPEKMAGAGSRMRKCARECLWCSPSRPPKNSCTRPSSGEKGAVCGYDHSTRTATRTPGNLGYGDHQWSYCRSD